MFLVSAILSVPFINEVGNIHPANAFIPFMGTCTPVFLHVQDYSCEADSELIYEWNLTLEIEVAHSFRLIRVCITAGNRLSISGSSYVRACLIIASWAQGTRGGSWSSPLLEVYTPSEDKYMTTGAKAVDLDLDGCQSAMWMPHIVISTSMMLIRIQEHRCRIQQLESPFGVSQAQWNQAVYPPKSMYRFAVKLTPSNTIGEASAPVPRNT
ncbi:hypothetical protein ARMGADRAFT_1075036 [Armillaria gallica]|uniref:Uncharacterized protein n=1 Tax=Armillaria gallica TaxID=47427 RepID=A0A2H3EFH5_ARMGA|nr:hypothetical protein ARMGADRAFT_1075036 [Armillaria gallica]